MSNSKDSMHFKASDDGTEGRTGSSSSLVLRLGPDVIKFWKNYVISLILISALNSAPIADLASKHN